MCVKKLEKELPFVMFDQAWLLDTWLCFKPSDVALANAGAHLEKNKTHYKEHYYPSRDHY